MGHGGGYVSGCCQYEDISCWTHLVATWIQTLTSWSWAETPGSHFTRTLTFGSFCVTQGYFGLLQLCSQLGTTVTLYGSVVALCATLKGTSRTLYGPLWAVYDTLPTLAQSLTISPQYSLPSPLPRLPICANTTRGLFWSWGEILAAAQTAARGGMQSIG